MTFSIARESVPEALLSAYDSCAKGGESDKVVDTQQEVTNFFKDADLVRVNAKISRNEYDTFMKSVETVKKESDEIEMQKYKAWQSEQKAKIKQKIAQLEADIKKFEDYKKENPKTSAMHDALNKTELVAEGVVNTIVVGIVSIIPFVSTKHFVEVGKRNMDDVKKNGNVQGAQYNKLRAKADYEKLEYLKKLVDSPYPPMMALMAAAK